MSASNRCPKPNTRRTRLGLVLLALLLSASATACEDDKPSSTDSTQAEAGAPKPAVDPDLAAAMAAASARAPSGAPVSVPGGPPERGVFAPGAADKELARGAQPKLTVGAEGETPGFLLSHVPSVGSKATGTVMLSIQNDPRQPALPIEFDVTLETQRPPAVGAAEGAPAAPRAVEVVARVRDARITSTRAPEELVQELRKLKGSKIMYRVLPNGFSADVRQELAKPVAQEFADILRSLGEALTAVTLPVPAKPVGQGAFWMATTREAFWGVDTVTYRMIKLERAVGEELTFGVNTKRYMTDNVFDTPSVRADGKLLADEFQAVAEAQVKYKKGQAFPQSGNLMMSLAAAVHAETTPTQQGNVQAQTRARFAFDVK
jgi:hypothetical protein